MADSIISFGPYSLMPARRLLLRGGEAVEVGSRALDVLIVLAEAAGDVVSQRELLDRAWPNLVVAEGSLRVTIAGLRKDLGDGLNGARYITNVTGRGYCFVAPVTRSRVEPMETAPVTQPAAPPRAADRRLPPQLARMVGRADAVETLTTLLLSRRFVSVVGPAGVGKTTVAVSVGHALLDAFGDAVYFVDLSDVADPTLVASTVGAVLGVTLQTEEPLSDLLASLPDRRVLLILDNCEHVIDAAALLTERLYSEAPQAHILTTSREALRVEGEHVHLLAPLDYPPRSEHLTAAEALAGSAVQLFMDRAFAAGHTSELSDAEAPLVADICRRLDGIPFAIELAASRVGAYGLQGTADLLSNRFKLLWQGRRSAPPRQQTLMAMLDWSFNLLSDRDRRVLGRLSMFVGVFTLDAVQTVTSDDHTDPAEMAEAVASLVDKSLVLVVPINGVLHHRLLDTTRAYAAEKLRRSADANAIARNHALYFEQWLMGDGGKDLRSAVPHVGNVRAALEWCFGSAGDASIGVRLAAAVAPLFFGLSLLAECVRWSERGILALDDATRGGPEEMLLQANLGISLMQMRGESDAARAALSKGLAIAERRGDALNQVGLLGMVSMSHLRNGDFKAAVHYARLGRAVAGAEEDPVAMALANAALGGSLHSIGAHDEARAELEASLQYWSRAGRNEMTYLGFDHHILAGLALAGTLWLQGHPGKAVERGRQTIEEAERRNHPASLADALTWGTAIFLWLGDLESGEAYADRLISHAEAHSLRPYLAVGRGYQGALAIHRGAAGGGVETLQDALKQLHEMCHELLNTEFTIWLVQGLSALGRFAEGRLLVDEAIQRIEAKGEHLCLPELLRTKGRLLLAEPQSDSDGAEMYFMQSLELSRRQGARAWELRTATDLAALMEARGRSDDARAVLEPVFEQFTEGLETADVKAAGLLLATLERK